MAILGNYLLIGEGMVNREIGVNRNKSGETAHVAELCEGPQWPILHVQGVAEGSRVQGKGYEGKAVP